MNIRQHLLKKDPMPSWATKMLKGEVVTGVYKITNTITNDLYIGSSRNVFRRWQEHRKPSALDHDGLQLYQAFNDYGLDNFDFEVIKECDLDNLRRVEQRYISDLHPTYNNGTAFLVSGIFMVTNLMTGETYIESAKHLDKRMNDIQTKSCWLRRPQFPLYRDLLASSHGFESSEEFRIESLETCPFTELAERKKYWVDEKHPAYNKKGTFDKKKYQKEYQKHSDKAKEARQRYQNRLCIYNGEELTFCALKHRFIKAGIPNPTEEAKKYLKK